MSATKTITLLLLFLSLNTFSQSKTGYSLVWEDNFNGTSLDTSSWSNEVAKPGWVNNELQHYTNGENVEFADGKLLIIAKKENNGSTHVCHILFQKGKPPEQPF